MASVTFTDPDETIEQTLAEIDAIMQRRGEKFDDSANNPETEELIRTRLQSYVYEVDGDRACLLELLKHAYYMHLKQLISMEIGVTHDLGAMPAKRIR